MEKLDDVLLERILRQLQPVDLSATQLTCRHWSCTVSSWQLWKPHALAAAGKPTEEEAAAANSTTSCFHQCLLHQQTDWRRIYIDRMAASRLSAGKLTLSATLLGHTAPITSTAARDNVILTGSQDMTARVWRVRPQQQQPQFVLHHAAPVSAVGIVSVDLCVTAAAATAWLWRRGQAIRRFDVIPGGTISCLALTDTQLLLGTTAGTLHFFDLYSGAQQLITRHERAVTALLTYQPQQQQEQQSVEDDQPQWCVIVGSADGQVCCRSCATGQQLWQLNTTDHAAVRNLSIMHYNVSQQQQHEPQQQPEGKHQLPSHQRQQQQQQQCRFLLVLNARPHLTLWQLPNSSSSSSSTRSPTASVPLIAACNGAAVSLAVPEYGSGKVLVGIDDGSLLVVQCAAQKAVDECTKALAMHSGTDSHAADTAAAAAAVAVEGGVAAGVERVRQQMHPGDYSNLQQQQQQHVVANALMIIGSSSSSSDSSDIGGQLKVVRNCSLSKLAVVLAKRYATAASTTTTAAAVAAAVGGSRSESNAIDVGVTCMRFTAAGQLLVGLASGHACLLKFKQQQQQQQSQQA